MNIDIEKLYGLINDTIYQSLSDNNDLYSVILAKAQREIELIHSIDYTSLPDWYYDKLADFVAYFALSYSNDLTDKLIELIKENYNAAKVFLITLPFKNITFTKCFIDGAEVV